MSLVAMSERFFAVVFLLGGMSAIWQAGRNRHYRFRLEQLEGDGWLHRWDIWLIRHLIMPRLLI